MKHTALLLLIAAATVAASAQTPAKPATTSTTTAKTATTTHTAATGIKLPPGVPPARGILKSAFALKYQDIKLGTGADAEPNKLYKVHYTGWLAETGAKFDSSFDHPGVPEKDKDGKPVLGDDGKPKLGDPQPIQFPQGMGRVMPGFDQGFYGMKVGGKRRLFIPWQLAYGTRGRPGPDAAHPGIPPKADLIFDVELVDVADMPTPPQRPNMPPGRMPPGRMPPGMTPHPPAGAAPGAPPTPGAAPSAPGAAPATPPSTTPPPNATAPAATPAPGAPAPAKPATPTAPTTPPPTTPPPSN